ncbi:hypothetical protein TEQG_01118 [Trichophyton equinum CBS 127.97]|uniref:Uncharacterized protein n=1 Tax=Trichophyton equinum (strain ATCC MYA-4606 / CBS 127.97) TaxID=559882 RepID=F2PJL1_TRIEC|nr:hypothetical protein TEQG_01118 [Trichophyton equinum CBS 127.97]
MKQVKEDMVIKGGVGEKAGEGWMHALYEYAPGAFTDGEASASPSSNRPPSYRHQYGVAHRYLNYPTRLKSQKAKMQIIANLRRYPYLMGNRHYPQRFVFRDLMPCAHRSTTA